MVGNALLLFCIISLIGTTNAAEKPMFPLTGKKIVNGHDTTIQNFPYQATLQYNNEHFCGGSIIGARHILTAAHCLVNEMFPPYNPLTVVTGTSWINKSGNVHNVSKITTHPDFLNDNNRALNDIAVITLTKPIVFNKRHQKINIPKHNYKVGDKAIVTGWGLTIQSPEKHANKLQKLTTELMSKQECQKLLLDPKKIQILDTEICTIRRPGSGFCLGDSGGPLVVHNEVVGIVSWFDGDNCAGYHPDVFTNVYKFKDFIESAMHEKSLCIE